MCPSFTALSCDRGSFTVQRRAVEKGIQMFGWDACHIRRLVGASRTCSEVRQQVWKSSVHTLPPVTCRSFAHLLSTAVRSDINFLLGNAQLVALGGVSLGPEAAAAAAAGTGRADRRKAAHPTRRKNHSQARLCTNVVLPYAGSVRHAKPGCVGLNTANACTVRAWGLRQCDKALMSKATFGLVSGGDRTHEARHPGAVAELHPVQLPRQVRGGLPLPRQQELVRAAHRTTPL